MNEKILLPQMLWQDYNVEELPLNSNQEKAETEESHQILNYRFTASGEGKDAVLAAVTVYKPILKAINQAVLIVQNYNSVPEQRLIRDLTHSGYVVVVPDISGVAAAPTAFGEKYAYGNYSKAGDRLKRITGTAKDTCQYLYTVIVKRTLYFMSQELKLTNPILVGLGDAVEVAMQVAGTGSPIKALACLNGSGYAEYIKLNKFGGGEELVMDEERLAWLSGVASVAYAKNITVPIIVAIGTNSATSDMDRLKNLIALVPTADVTTVLSTRTSGFLNKKAYNTFKLWMAAIAAGTALPKYPTLALRVNEDGKPYADVTSDSSSNINEVAIYYSCGEYNHQLRDWIFQKAVTISQNQYIAALSKYDAEAPLFAYAEVSYTAGFTLTSMVEYLELKGQPVKANEVQKSRIVYQPTFGTDCFVEDCGNTVMCDDNIAIWETENGTKGIKSATGGLKTYNIGTHSCYFEDSILQIELYSDKNAEVTLSVQEKVGNGFINYSHKFPVTDTKGFFNSFQLKAADFKGEKFMPLTSWKSIKSLAVHGENIVVGNILFI